MSHHHLKLHETTRTTATASKTKVTVVKTKYYQNKMRFHKRAIARHREYLESWTFFTSARNIEAPRANYKRSRATWDNNCKDDEMRSEECTTASLFSVSLTRIYALGTARNSSCGSYSFLRRSSLGFYEAKIRKFYFEPRSLGLSSAFCNPVNFLSL